MFKPLVDTVKGMMRKARSVFQPKSTAHQPTAPEPKNDAPRKVHVKPDGMTRGLRLIDWLSGNINRTVPTFEEDWHDKQVRIAKRNLKRALKEKRNIDRVYAHLCRLSSRRPKNNRLRNVQVNVGHAVNVGGEYLQFCRHDVRIAKAQAEARS